MALLLQQFELGQCFLLWCLLFLCLFWFELSRFQVKHAHARVYLIGQLFRHILLSFLVTNPTSQRNLRQSSRDLGKVLHVHENQRIKIKGHLSKNPCRTCCPLELSLGLCTSAHPDWLDPAPAKDQSKLQITSTTATEGLS